MKSRVVVTGGCRVVGCVALASAPRRSISDVSRLGLCAVHQQFPADELAILLKREAGMVAPLKPIAVGIEYERADGSQWGIDHDGNYYDVPRSNVAQRSFR